MFKSNSSTSSKPPAPTPDASEDGATGELDIDLENVKYGDVVFLRGSTTAFVDPNGATATKQKNIASSVGPDGYLHADTCFERVGFQVEDRSSDLTNFDECLFTVCPMLNYDSVTTKKFLMRRPSFSGDIGEQEVVDLRIKQEEEQNEVILKKTEEGEGAEEVLYGQIIQLRHNRSSKFLKCNSITADVEKDCLKLTLSDGDENCHFRMMPRFKVRHEGSAAYFGDMLKLSPTSFIGDYGVHISPTPYDFESSKPYINEINLSQNASSLKIIKYVRDQPANPSTFCQTNLDFVRFFHPESESFLGASCNLNKDDVIEDVVPATSASNPSLSLRLSSAMDESSHNEESRTLGSRRMSKMVQKFESPSSTSPTKSKSTKSLFGKSSKGITEKKHRPYLRKLVDPSAPSSDENISAKSVFVFERDTNKHSAGVEWETPIRIRHVATNKFLYVQTSPETGNDGRTIYRTGMTNDPSLRQQTYFFLTPTDNQGRHVPKANVSLCLEHHVGNKVLHMTSGVKRKDEDKNIIEIKSFDMFFSQTKGDNDAFLLFPMEKSSKFATILSTIMSVLKPLNEFANRVKRCDKIRRSDIKRSEWALATIIYSSDLFFDKKEYEKMMADSTFDPLDAKKFTNASSPLFQNIAREVKLLDALFAVATAPSYVPGLTLCFDEATQRFEDSAFAQISNTTKMAWHALQQCFKSNHTSENYFASQPGWINPGIIQQIADPVGAAIAFEKLISENAKLLEDCVDESIINAFMSLIMERGPQARLMNFFSSICTCQGRAIISNQETCLSQLWLNDVNNKKILFQVYQSEKDTGAQLPLDAEQKDVPATFLGKSDMQAGFKEVRVSWQNMPTMQDLKIRDRLNCPLSQFCTQLSDENMIFPLSQLSPPNKKLRQVGLYFVAQVDMFANMCYGRSYNCIAGLQKAFPYTMLIGIIKEERLAFVVRKVFTKLIHRLWVDRYPHSPNCGRPSLPDLAWVYTELKKKGCNDPGALPSFDLGKYHSLLADKDEFLSMQTHTKFFLLRDFINGYLKSMNGKQTIGLKSKNELTATILSVASDLMSFGFFATKDKVADLCIPLLPVLDGRGDAKLNKDQLLHMISSRSLGRDSESAFNHVNPLGKQGNSGIDLAASTDDQIEMIDIEDPKSPLSGSPGKRRSLTMFGGASSKRMQQGDFWDELSARKKVGMQRWDIDADTVRVMSCKINMVKVLGGVANIRVNYRISQFMYAFKDFTDRGIPLVDEEGTIIPEFFEKFQDLFTSPNGSALDIEKLANAPLDTMLLDLLMYKSDDVFESSLAFLRRRYGQRRALIGFLPKLTLLNTPRVPVFNDFKMLDQELQELRYYMRSYQVWGVQSSTSPMDPVIFHRVEITLKQLVDFIYSESDTSSTPIPSDERDRIIAGYTEDKSKKVEALTKVGTGKRASASDMNMGQHFPPSITYQSRTANKHHQSLLRNMGMAREVLFHGVAINYNIMASLNALNGAKTSPELEALTRKSKNWLYTVCKNTVFALAAFVDGNTENQEILFSKLDLLRSKMGVGMFVWDVVISIFENNINLAEVCPPALYVQFAELLEGSNYSCRHLDFFINLIEPEKHGRILTKNQNLTMAAIGDSKYSKTLLLSPPEGTSSNAKETKERMKFYVKSVKLLALATKGRNTNTGAKCQSFIPLEKISHGLASVANKRGDDSKELTSALISFTNYVYVDTPLIDQQLADSKDMWGILVVASNLATSCWKEIAQGEDVSDLQDDIMYASLNLLSSFFKDVYNASQATRRIMAAVNLIKDDMKFITRPNDFSSGALTPFKAEVCNRSVTLATMVQNAFAEDGEETGHFRIGAGGPSDGARPTSFVSTVEIANPYSSDSLKRLMMIDKQKYMELVMDSFGKSELAKAAMAKKDIEFITLIEDVEARTDPDDIEYLEAGSGQSLSNLDDDESWWSRLTFHNVCEWTLDMILGSKMLAVILTLTLVAAVATGWQMAASKDIQWMKDAEYYISWFFIVELTVRIFAWLKVKKEFDNFLLDPLNLIDMLVVAVDVILMASPDGGEGDFGGLVKALRGARGFRLLRLLRAARIMRNRKVKVKMTKAQALKDPRNVKITFKDLIKRFLTFIDNHIDRSVEKEKVLKIALDVLSLHLEKSFDLTDIEHHPPGEIELLDATSDEVEEARQADFEQQQTDMVELDAASVIVKILSAAESDAVCFEAFRLGRMMTKGGFEPAQENFVEYLLEEDKEGKFFFAIREKLRSSKAALAEYRDIKEVNPSRAQEFIPDCKKSMTILDFLGELCEGHNASAQDMLRVQPTNLKTFNIVEEALDILSLQGKSLPIVRGMDDFEAVLMKSTLGFVVEAIQGPCTGNQDLIIKNPKLLDVCKNILSSGFTYVKESSTKYELYYLVSALFAALLEGRNSDKESQKVLLDALPYDLIKKRLESNDKICKNVYNIKNGGRLEKTGDLMRESEVSASIEKGSILSLHLSKEKSDDWMDAHLQDGWKEMEKVHKEGLVDELLEFLEGERRNLFNFVGELSSLKIESNPYVQEDQGGRGKKKVKVDEDDPTIEDNTDVRKVEVWWKDASYKAYFTLPKEWKSFSDASKANFLDSTDLSNSEVRAKSLMEKANELYEEMQYQDKLSRTVFYRIFAERYYDVKKFTYLVVVLLNFNIMISKFSSLEEVNIYEDLVGDHLTNGEKITAILGLIAFVGYFACFCYLAISFGPLAFRRSNSLRKEMRKENSLKKKGEGKISSTEVTIILKWIFCIGFYACISLIMIESGNYAYETKVYVRNGLYFAYFTIPWVLRKFLVIPSSRVLGLYCACYDTLTYPPVFTNVLLIVSVLVGMDKAYWFTFTLLDVITMSPLLRATLTSVTRPIDQLAQTFALFIIVICCYTAVAFFLFGGASHFINGDDDNAPQACDTLIECFVFSLYVGIREGDMDAVLDDADMNDKTQWRNRIIYDLTFFIILGVLLFDVVTGVILDTFGELREEVNERKDKMENETFISGIAREKVEELGAEVEFDTINDKDQNVWNYLFYIIYLKNKDPSELNGIESYTMECIESDDTLWFPQKTCWRIEYSNQTIDDDKAPEELIEEQVDRLAELEETMKAMIKAMPKPTE